MRQIPAAAFVAVLGLVAAGAASAAPAAPRPFAFTGATLGMSLRAWRAVPYPGQADPHVQPICSGDPGAGRDAAIRPGADERKAGAVVCSYAARYGDDVLPQGIRPAADRSPVMVRYVFEGGRLAQISYEASRDAFDKVTHRLKAAYGAPRSVTRDRIRTEIGRLDRVRMSWAAPSGTAILTDPADAHLDLSVALSSQSPHS